MATEIIVKGSCMARTLRSLHVKIKKKQNKTKKINLTHIAVLYDMGWQKRGKGHNSLTGHGAVISPITGQVLSFATRCKTCRVCEASKKLEKAEKSTLVLQNPWREIPALV